jgi:hypothetical protein
VSKRLCGLAAVAVAFTALATPATAAGPRLAPGAEPGFMAAAYAKNSVESLISLTPWTQHRLSRTDTCRTFGRGSPS